MFEAIRALFNMLTKFITYTERFVDSYGDIATATNLATGTMVKEMQSEFDAYDAPEPPKLKSSK